MANTPINRESINTPLEQRYIKNRVGGSFDAKTVGTSTVPTSLQEKNFTSTEGFKTKVQLGQSEFKDAQGTSSKQLSSLVKGFSNKKYKP
jgi:hypothetical protein